MQSKRLSSAVGGGGGDESRPKRSRTIAELTVDEFKGLVRKLVREELEDFHAHNLYGTPRQPINDRQESRYRLHFLNRLPCELYTVNKIKAEDNQPVKIAIIDSISSRIVTTGPLASIKVEVVVLDGDFGGHHQETWSKEEFHTGIVQQREGKRPLLNGKLVVQLNNGVGTLSDAIFTDNSSWIRTRNFRLGAKVFGVDCDDHGRIQEARSEPFTVKEHRVESYQKKHLPALSDEVWRLEKIMRDGKFHSRLARRGIINVQDFLSFLVLDERELRSVLGKGMTKKIWESTLDHVRKIISGNEFFSFYSAAGHGVELVCNSKFKLVGANFGGDFCPLDVLTEPQKHVVTHLRKLALKNANDMVTLNAMVQVNQQPVDGSIPYPLASRIGGGSSLLHSEDLVSMAKCHDSQVGFLNQPSASCINPIKVPCTSLHADCFSLSRDFTVLGGESSSSISPRTRASLSIQWLKLRVVVKFRNRLNQLTMIKNRASKRAAILNRPVEKLLESAYKEVLSPWEQEQSGFSLLGSSVPGIQINEHPHQDYRVDTPDQMWDYVIEPCPRDAMERTMSEETAMLISYFQCQHSEGLDTQQPFADEGSKFSLSRDC